MVVRFVDLLWLRLILEGAWPAAQVIGSDVKTVSAKLRGQRVEIDLDAVKLDASCAGAAPSAATTCASARPSRALSRPIRARTQRSRSSGTSGSSSGSSSFNFKSCPAPLRDGLVLPVKQPVKNGQHQ